MDSIESLVEALRCLPGVGPKSARRMVFHLLQHQRPRGLHLAECLMQAMQQVTHCRYCNNYTESTVCAICKDTRRSASILCVVENPQDVHAIEQSLAYDGKYFVLMGKISPIDGFGPEEIHLPKLKQQVIEQNISEVVIALSACVEGQTTAHFIQQLLAQEAVTITQLAKGIPSAGELEFLDSHTIGNALKNRAKLPL